MLRRPASDLTLSPRACLVTGRADLEVIDFNKIAEVGEPPNVAIAVVVIEEAGRDHCGMLTAEQAEELRTENELLRTSLERYESSDGATDTQIENALERVLERRGVRIFFDDDANTTSDEPTSNPEEE